MATGVLWRAHGRGGYDLRLQRLRGGIRRAMARLMRARLISIAIHLFGIAALLFVRFGSTPKLDRTIEPPLPPIRLHLAPRPAPETKHSGGGDDSPTPATKGQLPQYAKRP